MCFILLDCFGTPTEALILLDSCDVNPNKTSPKLGLPWWLVAWLGWISRRDLGKLDKYLDMSKTTAFFKISAKT